MKDERICIVGLGLMGGSLALALRGSGAHVMGVDRDASALAGAEAAGAIVAGTQSLADGVQGATMAVLAAPVRAILDLLVQLPDACQEGLLVFDLGSSKQAICEAMDRLPPSFAAVGGHPMCGKELTGFAEADAELFREATFVLSPTGRTSPSAWERCVRLVEVVGGRPLAMPAERHDAIVALTSHVPYLVASLLMRQAARAAATDPQVWAVSAAGLRDTTRLSGTSPDVMRDILLTNRKAIRAELLAYGRALDDLVARLAAEEEAELTNWLQGAASAHSQYRAWQKDT